MRPVAEQDRQTKIDLDRAAIGIVTISLDGRILHVNPAMADLSGQDPADLTSRLVTDVLHPADQAAAVAERGALVQGRTAAAHFEARLVRPDGAPRSVLVTLTLERADSGNPAYFVVQAQDVTEQRAAIEELRATNARYRQILETTRDGIWQLDRDDRTIFVSDAMAALLGRPSTEIAGRSPADFTTPEGAERLRRARKRRRCGVRETYEMPFVRPDGKVIWTLVSAGPVQDDQGQYAGGFALVTDISGWREADEDRRHLASLVASTSEAVIGLDSDGRVTSWNPAAERLTGCPAGRAIGRRIADVVTLLDDSRVGQRMARVLGGERLAFGSTIERPGGGELDVHVSLSPVTGEGGDITGIAAMVRDVTAEVQAKRRLARHAAQQQAVASLGEQALEGLTVDAVMARACKAAAELLEVGHVSVFLLSEDQTLLRLSAGVGWDDREIGRFAVPLHNRPAAASALATGEPLIVPGIDARSEAPDDLSRRHGVHSAIAVPIRAEGAGLGMLAAHRSTPWPNEPADEVAFLQSVANVLAAAMTRASVDDEMHYRAMHDPLTGLPNRVLLNDRLALALASARRAISTVSVLLLDIDRFKVVNDARGHEAGDRLLVAVAERLRRTVRETDTVARLGGDEFVILCQDRPGVSSLPGVADRVIAALAEPLEIDGEMHPVSASAGLAQATGEVEPSALLRDADLAMYRAKAAGGARWEMFDDALHARMVDRVRVEHELRRAAERDQLRVLYQPIVDLATGEMTAVEALVRWQHPERGLVAPGDFIGVAEESGAIVDIGRWVLREACAEAARWRGQDADGPAFHVNLSPRQLLAEGLADDVDAALRAHGLPVSALVLELTESGISDEEGRAAATLQDLAARGVRMVIDDFGAGYSSLGRLQKLPIDGLKIDRSFVAQLRSGSPDAGIVTAIVAMGRALDLEVVAEGIEDLEQLQCLHRIGCPAAQGFLFARPMTAADARSLVGVRLTPDDV